MYNLDVEMPARDTGREVQRTSYIRSDDRAATAVLDRLQRVVAQLFRQSGLGEEIDARGTAAGRIAG